MARLARIGSFVLGIAFLAIGAAFFSTGRWTDSALPGADAASQPSASVSGGGADDVGDALAAVDGDELNKALLRLVADLQPTPTPKPTARPTAAPQAPPQQVTAPTGGGGPAPAAPPASNPQPAPPSQPSSPPSSNCPSASMNGYASALFSAINAERTSRGVPALSASGCATFVAQLRSDDMASNNYFSHTSPSGQTAFTLMDQYGVPHGWAGENLARNNYPNDQTVAVAIRDLMASPGHAANILNTNFTAVGVGMANDGAGMKYYTMVFIGPP